MQIILKVFSNGYIFVTSERCEVSYLLQESLNQFQLPYDNISELLGLSRNDTIYGESFYEDLRLSSRANSAISGNFRRWYFMLEDAETFRMIIIILTSLFMNGLLPQCIVFCYVQLFLKNEFKIVSPSAVRIICQGLKRYR